MLYIETSNKGIIHWHTGGSVPCIDISEVIEVQADGDELQYIQTHMPTLPHANHIRVVNWYGDHAKFIAGNLK